MSESIQHSPSVQFLEISEDQAGQRLDNFLLRLLKGVPKSYIYRIIRKGEVRINKGRVKADHRLQAGDQLRIPPVRMPAVDDAPKPAEYVVQRLTHAILYEDERILVLNKPSGLAVHGGSGLDYGLIEALRVLRPEESQLELVHRLDRDTSGCLIVSKRNSALRTLHELMRQDLIEKRYLALLAGSWRKGTQQVDAPLKKNTLQSGERVVRVDPEGKPALTRFKRLARYQEATLVEVELITGRTHQIRVHGAWIGSPVLGDEKYGDDVSNRRIKELGLKRLFLHAHSLKFRWPGESSDTYIKSPLPDELEAVLRKLKRIDEI